MNGFLQSAGVTVAGRNVTRLAWALILAYPFLYLWQGIDYGDEGNALVIYQRIFSDPASIADTYGTWGTSLVGGAWNLLFGNFGLAGFRVAGSLVSVLTFGLVYLLYRRYLDRLTIAIGMLVGVVYYHHFMTITLLGYNNLSLFLHLASIVLLVRGLDENRQMLIFAAAALIGFSVFVRLPNLLGLFMALAIAWHGWMQGTPARIQWRQWAVFAAGVVGSMIMSVLLLRVLDHNQYYLNSLEYLFASTGNADHGPYGNLIKPVFNGYYHLLFDGLVMLTLLLLAVHWTLRMDKYRPRLWLLPAAGALLLFWYFYDVIGIPVSGRLGSMLVVLCLVVSALYAFMARWRSGPLGVIGLLLLIQLVIWPLGSGAGFVNQLYLLPAALPLVVEFMRNVKGVMGETRFALAGGQDAGGSVVAGSETLHAYRKRALVLLLLFSAVNGFCFSYSDSYNRPGLRYAVDNQYLNHVYTTHEKAESLNAVLAELGKYVRKGDTLFVAWTAPLLNYLTETKPYFPHPWSEIYTRDEIERMFMERGDGRPLPVTVKYGNTGYNDILEEFLASNAYRRVWSNGEFAVYVPPAEDTVSHAGGPLHGGPGRAAG